MRNTSVLWPQVEVENSGSGCAHEMQIEIKPAPETRRSTARQAEAKRGNAYPAALAAVRTSRYEPTYLNDEPIDIQFILTVRFE